MDMNSLAHPKWGCKYHLVFAPKYRRQIIYGKIKADVFQISLDQLIKGDDNMSNMTEKVIKDGSETKRAKYNMISSVIGGVLLLIGVMFLVIKGMSVEYIDAEGILHENFFLAALGFLCIFCGLISFVTMGIRAILSKLKSRK